MPNRPRTVAFLITPPFDLLNLIGLTSVFSYPRIEGKPAYVSKILSTVSQQDLSSADGIGVSNSVPFMEYEGRIDTLVIVGGTNALDEPSSEVIRWTRKRASRVRRISSVGAGIFTLASTGLLDGKRVTTHWHLVERLSKRHPGLLVEKDPIFVKDGKFYSTAGVAAGIDMALMLVEEDFGHAVATSIARELILYIRRPGSEPQYSRLLAQQEKVCGTPMRDLPAWAKARLTKRLDINTLCKVVAMSPRTFARQFEGHFGMTPGRWVQSLRVESACAYLETHQLPIKAVARLTGFCDERSLRRAFQQQLGISPKEYRERLDLFDPQMIEDSTVVTVKDLQGSMKNHEYLVDRFPLGLNERPAEPLF